MKNSILITSMLAVFALGGCSKDDGSNLPANGKPIPVTITATRSEAPQTRVAYDDTDPSKLIVTWKSDKSDKIGVFATNSTDINTLFSINGDLRNNGKQADFAGAITPTNPNDPMIIYAYYPYSASQMSCKILSIELANQTQTNVGNTDHLSALDYMAALPVTYNRASEVATNPIPMAFEPLLTVMSFDVVNPSTTEPLTVNSIELATEGAGLFYQYVKVDITDNTFPITNVDRPDMSRDGIKLKVTGNNNIAPGAKGRFSVIMVPLTTGLPATLKAFVATPDNTYFQEKAVPAGGFERGGRYIMKLDKLEESVIPTAIAFDRATINTVVGQTETLKVNFTPANTTDKRYNLYKKSNDPIEIDKYTNSITAMEPGTFNIDAISHSGQIKASCIVNVVAKPVPVTGVTLNKTSATLSIGATETLTATVNPTNATNKTVTWRSSNTTVATVSATGVVTTKAAGTATITVTTTDGGKTATCVVTVKAPTDPDGTPTNPDGTITDWDPETGAGGDIK